MSRNPLFLPLQAVPGMTPAREALLARLGHQTVGDLLFHFPRTYEDLRDKRAITSLVADLTQTVEGEIVNLRTVSRDGRLVVSILLTDGGPERLEGVWYAQAGFTRRFRLGQRVSFSGQPKRIEGRWRMIAPRVQLLGTGQLEGPPGLVPVYPLTEDLRPATLRLLIGRALDRFEKELPEPLPAVLRERYGLPEIAAGLRAIHEPRDWEEIRLAQQRFAYQELLELQVGLALRRREIWQGPPAPCLQVTPAIDQRIRQLFPFTLTGDQNKAIADIVADLAGPRPMQRLIQADVGAGKTALAIYAMLATVANRYQAALMAPTEVLARQHAQTLERLLGQSRVRRLLLTGSLSAREKRQALDALAAGEIDLVVGTQALVQQGVRFARLGLVVIDEQHKFGVHQRAQVRQLGCEPHYLVMTATPIPRTVALTVFGDLDVTLVREMPAGRLPVTTRWLSEDQRASVYAQLAEALRAGRQAYIVCPVVENHETLRSAEAMYKHLSCGPLRDFRLGLLHGRMDDAVKADVMERFRRREFDVLIATSVVEVGVDVPNATWLIIEQAERFGLSQLHQLRGRVSRGSHAGVCILFGEPLTDEGKQRLRALVQTSDGFTLAEEDARLRGTGDVFGTRQHGNGELWMLAQSRLDLLEHAHMDARQLVSQGIEQYPALHAAVLARYGDTLELSGVG
ncbi:MAG: ATP-dependent DNA helicase RecG [Gemmataceae bacterium]